MALRYQIKATLKDSTPHIWRRFVVPSTISLGKLHTILQILFQWEDYHLHQFTIDKKAYGLPDPEEDHFWGTEVIDENEVLLSEVITRVNQRFDYWYDFGDNWHHDIVIEKIMPKVADMKPLICIAGKRVAPPEDVGGISGYAHFLEVINNPHHKDYQFLREWIGEDFDSEACDIEAINKELDELPVQ